ncbi:rab11 family-interacting protein 1 isoform X3 [Oxyura jamaicensis]|nr:rab11 family-interacting protein 1 isoform X3 [Oxyura jamaicensis]
MSAPGWAPTHVQVTVLRARGLRAKAAAGGSDAYAVMALGRDKFSTSVAERCQGRPEWRQEATFELPPRAAAALRLTVLHRALVGLDKFLGRAEVDLAALRGEGGRRHTRWYKLRSKPGKKEKERGEIEVDIQFMRSNMTASMFDLSMKDKSRSPFGKIKDKLKGKRSSGLSDTASEIVPSTTHSPADSEDESAEKEKEKKKSKFKTLFSKPGLQKTSLSQSMSVLPTPQPGAERVRLRPSDFQSQWDDDDSETSPTSERAFGNALEEKSPSPVFKSRKTATLDNRQLNQITTSNTKKEGLSLFGGLKSKNDPVSKSSLCINGTHVYMEESALKDNTPASSPSPLNFRRKQLFASEENLSSRSAKGPEEVGRTSPSNALSGSASLETFKSMTLPSYKLLSSEENLETSTPLTVEVIKETKKTDHKKSALLSLVTGKKEAAKTSDTERIPDRTPKEEETKAAEEKSEQEAKRLEFSADLSRGNPPEDSHLEEVPINKQPLNPFEEEQKPEKEAAPAKTKAVKPRGVNLGALLLLALFTATRSTKHTRLFRKFCSCIIVLGVPAQEETKATLPSLAPGSFPAFLPVHRINSENNPFISKTGQNVPAPGSESTPSSSASLPSPLTAELLSGKNPFSPSWERASPALDSEHAAHLPHHLAAPGPRAPLPRQVSGSGNNPFASAWGQGPESSATCASWAASSPPAPSLPSGRPYNGNNPFVSRLGGGPGVPGFQAVAGSSPFCPPCGAGCSSAAHPADLKRSVLTAPGGSSDVAVTGNVRAVSDPPGALSVGPGLAPKQQCDSTQVQADDSLKGGKVVARKCVSFQLGESQPVPSGGEDLGGQHREKQLSDFRGVLPTDADTTGSRAGFAGRLEAESCPSLELCSGSTNPIQNSKAAAQDGVEIGSVSTEPCLKGGKPSASLSECSNSLLPGNGAERPPSAERELNEKQEILSEKRREECTPTLEPRASPFDKNDSFSQAECTKAALGAHTQSVTPKPAPRLSLALKKCPPVSQTDELSDVPSSAEGVKSACGLSLPNEKPLDARGCLPPSGSLTTLAPAVKLRADSSNRHLKTEGGDDLFDCLTNLRSAIPVTADRGVKLSGLPAIPEGGSDDELLGDCQENCGVDADDENVLEAGKLPVDAVPLHEELKESSGTLAAARVMLAAQGGGNAPGVCTPPARVRVHSNQRADSGLRMASHSRECSGCFETQELKTGADAEERAESDFSEPSVSSSSLSSSSQPCSAFRSFSSDTPSHRAESPKKPTAEGFADKAGISGKKKLLQAWVSPSETYPNQTQQGGETMSPKHR